MVFYADSAREIVRIINHRRNILLGIPISSGKHVNMYSPYYADAATQYFVEP